MVKAIDRPAQTLAESTTPTRLLPCVRANVHDENESRLTRNIAVAMTNMLAAKSSASRGSRLASAERDVDFAAPISIGQASIEIPDMGPFLGSCHGGPIVPGSQ